MKKYPLLEISQPIIPDSVLENFANAIEEVVIELSKFNEALGLHLTEVSETPYFPFYSSFEAWQTYNAECCPYGEGQAGFDIWIQRVRDPQLTFFKKERC